MEIKYYGHSCFKIKGKDVSIVIDPFDPQKVGYKLPKLEADILVLSHDHADHNYRDAVSDYRLLIDTPGEFELGGAFVTGFHTYHDNKEGQERGDNIIYQIELDDLSILHLGDLGHELSKEILEKISVVDVLFIPVGGVYTIDAKTAVKVISSLEPGIVVPMHYQTDDLTGLSQKLDGLDKFLEEMGNGDVVSEEKLKLSGKNDIPEETEVIVLTK